VLLRLFIYPLVEPSARIWVISAGRIVISIVWVVVYTTRPEATSVNPFLNGAVSVGTQSW
jgi:hypothetical protein